MRGDSCHPEPRRRRGIWAGARWKPPPRSFAAAQDDKARLGYAFCDESGYNDAYSVILGEKHPAALGARGRDVWPEIWPIIGPMLDQVMREGRATWSDDQMLMLHRHGFSEEC